MNQHQVDLLLQEWHTLAEQLQQQIAQPEKNYPQINQELEVILFKTMRIRSLLEDRSGSSGVGQYTITPEE